MLARGRDADNALPAGIIRVKDQAVATSGPGARDRLIGGARLQHTLMPADGQPASARTVTVVADNVPPAVVRWVRETYAMIGGPQFVPLPASR